MFSINVNHLVFLERKRQQTTIDIRSPKKIKKPCLIAEYASSDTESNEEDDDDEEEENVDDIDELLNEVLDKKEKVQQVDLYPLFEANCRAAIDRLTDLGDTTPQIFTLRIQLEVNTIFCFFYNKLNLFIYLDTSRRLSCWSSI